MRKIPARIENPQTGKSARLRKAKGRSNRYYLDLYTHEEDGSPRYSTCSPTSLLTFTQEDALDRAREWCGT